jgi:hypothetical protein
MVSDASRVNEPLMLNIKYQCNTWYEKIRKRKKSTPQIICVITLELIKIQNEIVFAEASSKFEHKSHKISIDDLPASGSLWNRNSLSHKLRCWTGVKWRIGRKKNKLRRTAIRLFTDFSTTFSCTLSLPSKFFYRLMSAFFFV